MNIRRLLKERQREVPKVELLKFLEAVGDCDTEMDFDETRCTSGLVAPLHLANIANGRPMKDVRLEFVYWARDRRFLLTLEDNKIWSHMKVRAGHKALVDDASEAGLQHWRLVLSFSATRAQLHRVNTPLGCAATCSSHVADTSSHIVTLPRAKKTGPSSASQADSVVSECASSEASIPLGGDATTFRKSLLTQLEEATTNQKKDDNGAVTGEAMQEEALSKLPDVPVPAEAKTEVVVRDELKNVDMHRAAEQMFVPPLPLDSAKRASAESASASSKRMKSETLSQSLVCTGAAMDITWCFGGAV